MAVRPLRPQPDKYSYGGVRLWRDDLEAIESLILEAYPEDRLSIFTDSFAVDRISDLADSSEVRVRTLTIRTADKSFEVRLTPFGSTVELSNKDTLSKGVVAAIGEIFRQRRYVSWNFIFACIMSALCVVAAVGYLAIVASTLDFTGESQTEPSDLVPAALFTVFVLFALLGGGRYAWSTRRACQIITRTRAEAPTFVSRKRDDLVINGISLFAGGVIGYLINMIS